MIYRCVIGSMVEILLDDELDERPTPEVARDYIRACSDEALRTYLAIPDSVAVKADDTD